MDMPSRTPESGSNSHTPRRGNSKVLIAIAVFKLIKALLLIAIGIGAVALLDKGDTIGTLHHVARELGLDPNRRLITQAIAKISGVDRRKLEEVGVGTFAYAIVFLVEGSGLLLHRRWAEYLTVVVTASFIPFEIYELAHEPSAMKAAGLILNALIVAYLVLRRWRERGESQA